MAHLRGVIFGVENVLIKPGQMAPHAMVQRSCPAGFDPNATMSLQLSSGPVVATTSRSR